MNNFERLDLYPHNMEASRKLKEAFEEGEHVVSIIHATGTGKTYNALYLALEYKDEKIVWLVPTLAIKEHIEKIINDNPNLSMERDFPNLEIRTYASLVNMTKKEIENIPCDLLIVDELHHLGAPVWGDRVTTFVETHDNMKTFGMTAYTVRDRGTIYERDMVNSDTGEIFSDSVVSEYDLYDAMVDGILPKPIVKTVVTEESEIIQEIREKIELLKNKGDQSYLEYEKMLDDIVKIIHKQNGVKKLIQQSVKPNGKYIYFCPVLSEDGKNDMSTIMDQMVVYLKEKYPDKKIVFYKTTSADGNIGKYNRDCFYNDVDLDGNDVSDTIRIMFAKNQYNEGVHAPNVDGVFLGRRTSSDIVAFEQIGRALSVRGNTHDKMEEYSNYTLGELREIAVSRGISLNEEDTKEKIIEKLISPIIIDLADDIDFIEELETNLGDRVKEETRKGPENQRVIKITDSTFDIEIINKDLFKILKDIRGKLRNKTWDEMYGFAVIYYEHYGNSEISFNFKTKNGIDYDETGVKLWRWCAVQRQKKGKMSEERKHKLKQIEFRFESNLRDLKWEQMYGLALAYYKYHGNSEIRRSFKTKNGYEYDETGVRLGQWCILQRTNQDQLSKERKQKLEQIEFRFESDLFETRWQQMYELALAYYKYHGNSEIRRSFKTKKGYEYNEDGVRLGQWCEVQRQNEDKLSEERRKKLELIEFRFVSKKDNEDRKQILCDQHQISYNKYPWLKRMSYQELYAKIKFLKDYNYPLEVNGDLHEIFSMSNENMILKYMISKEELITQYYINVKERGI